MWNDDEDDTAETAAPAAEQPVEAAGPKPLFLEVQSPPWPVSAAGVCLTAAGIARSVTFLPLPFRLGALVLLSGGAGTLAARYLVPMTTEVFEDHVKVTFGKKTRYRVPLKNVIRAYARSYRPLLEYGGWGIRLGPSGRAFTMRGQRGAQLILKSGTRLLIGSENAEALAETIASAAKCDTQPEPEPEAETVE